MYDVVCGVHQKPKPQGEAVLLSLSLSLLLLLQAFAVLTGDARIQEAVVSNFWNKHRLQMNETVVRFNLVNTWCYATFRGFLNICENKANPQTKGWNHGSFVISEGKILSFHHSAIYIKLCKPFLNCKRNADGKTGGKGGSHAETTNKTEQEEGLK